MTSGAIDARIVGILQASQDRLAIEEKGTSYQVAAQWRSRSTDEESQLVAYMGNPLVANSSCCKDQLWAIPRMSTTIDLVAAGRRSW